MKFTIVFPSHESEDLSVAAVFTPCLVWKIGSKEILNPHPENPHYQRGDLKQLLDETDISKRISDHTKRVTVVAHTIGHGTSQYLQDLVADLKKEGFEPSAVHQ